MLFAEGIVARYKARGNQLPHRSKTCRMDPNREQVSEGEPTIRARIELP
jgi:hypothetical protein